jgi:beta-barrel assembly-enhancing protease
MLLRAFLLILLGFAPGALAPQTLPDLGDAAQASFSVLEERRLGEEIMREIRASRGYYDDPEAIDYINALGNRLVASSGETRQDFEFFLMQDRSINAFALPGGFIGIHTGLLLAAQSESEVASVFAHEIAHVTQRHIARILAQQKSSGLM